MNIETYGEEFIGVYCYGDIDEEDFFRFKEEIRELSKDEIYIEHDIMGSCIVSRFTFIEIMYKYSLLLLFYNRNNQNLGIDWRGNMLRQLKKLRTLLNE